MEKRRQIGEVQSGALQNGAKPLCQFPTDNLFACELLRLHLNSACRLLQYSL